jgi:hypothetical protein
VSRSSFATSLRRSRPPAPTLPRTAARSAWVVSRVFLMRPITRLFATWRARASLARGRADDLEDAVLVDDLLADDLLADGRFADDLLADDLLTEDLLTDDLFADDLLAGEALVDVLFRGEAFLAAGMDAPCCGLRALSCAEVCTIARSTAPRWATSHERRLATGEPATC